MPIACVDVVATFDDSVLVVQRAIDPLKGSWYLPGGRLLRGEKISRAAVRLVKTETGMDIGDVQIIGVDEGLFDTDPFGHGDGTHTVAIVCSALLSGGKIKVGKNECEARLIRWTNPPIGVSIPKVVLNDIHRAFELRKECEERI